MALYKIRVSYDGTEYFGFQRQLNKRTIQGELENALGKLGWAGKSIIASGRTDAGVHAIAQVVTFELNWSHNEETLQKALNSQLPVDISVRCAELAEYNFHPRYNAKYRKYRYQIYISSTPDPLLERYNWRVWPKVDLDLMNQAAEVLIGNKDFSALGKPYKKEGRTRRIIELANWERISDKRLFFTIRANSFLYHMVRRITFVLVNAGQHKVKIESIKESLNGNDNLQSGIAPAKGLFLEEIIY
jgi:tRNA pseudouridine38-40 synthase